MEGFFNDFSDSSLIAFTDQFAFETEIEIAHINSEAFPMQNRLILKKKFKLRILTRTF